MGFPIRESKNNKSTFRLCFCCAQKACIEWWVITNTTGSSSCMLLIFPFFPSFLSSNLSSFSVPIFFSLLLSSVVHNCFVWKWNPIFLLFWGFDCVQANCLTKMSKKIHSMYYGIFFRMASMISLNISLLPVFNRCSKYRSS